MTDAPNGSSTKHKKLESEVRDMNIKEEEHGGDIDMDSIHVAQSVKEERSASMSGDEVQYFSGTPGRVKKQSRSPVKAESMMQSPAVKGEEEVVGGDIELKLEPGKPPKLQRKSSHKVERRPPPLFLDYEDRTAQATATYYTLAECTYANKYLGTTEHALECDCAEEWDSATRTNDACGDDSDCINRATKMECVGDCGCGANCQNQRFQRKEWAEVTVIKTKKKGYGLRADSELKPNAFIYEYIGEVIGENAFRKRMQNYDEEGIKHFYFMSLTKGEFVDATKKGNLGRFCNHSCNPNCYVDKWVVGDRLRMGIFAERKIRPGEELTFNYNVDRYGAEPQPCYCGEPNCTGYIGGKTQTERGTKLSNAIIEALGIDDAEAWDTAIAKKPRKKKSGEDDEEYVNNVEPRGLDEEGVNKVMSSLMQCKEKWIAVKLLTRIQRADDEKVRNRVVRFHGYRILKTALSNFIDDVNVCLQVLDVLDKMPRLTRNKIQDSKIEETVEPLAHSEDERVAAQAKALLESWSKLEVGYRIPRMKRDPTAMITERKSDRVDRRESERRKSRSRSRSKSPERIQAPTGPRNNAPQRAPAFFPGARPPPRFRPPPPTGPLPAGWFEATAANGSVYYYNQAGNTTWQRPTIPATNAPPPPPPKAVSDQQMIQDLIKNIVSSAKEPAKPASATSTPADTPKKKPKEEKWRSLPEEKQKKMYEATLQPHIMHVVAKYKHKLEKDDLKRWAKEFAKKMVESDFKKRRVEDPSKISDKQAKSVRKHTQDFFEKAVKKKEEAEKRRNAKTVKNEENSKTPPGSPPATAGSPMDQDDVGGDVSEVEVDDTPAEPNNSPTALKRRREDPLMDTEDDSTLKKLRFEGEDETALAAAPPPPPPPPPPLENVTDDDAMEAEQITISPEEDVSGSFTHEAIVAVHDATFGNRHSESDVDNGFAIKGAADMNGHLKAEITQIATPPTTGSPDEEEAVKAQKRHNFEGMNPDRMRRLGLLDGASE